MSTQDKLTEPNIRKIARIEDKATSPSTFLEVIEFTKPDAERGQLELEQIPVDFTHSLRA